MSVKRRRYRMGFVGWITAFLVGMLLATVAPARGGAQAPAISFAPAPGSPLLSAGGISAVAPADFNRNGRSDLVVVAQPGTGPEGNAYTLLGNPDGTFTNLVGNTLDVPLASGSLLSAAGDVNGDGTPGFVVASGGTSGAIIVNNGLGQVSFACPTAGPCVYVLTQGNKQISLYARIPLAGNPQSEAVGDVNGDGKPDLVVAEETGTEVFLGNGDGTFRPAPGSPLPVGGMRARVVAADLDGDGKSDLVIGNPINHNIAILLSNGDGTFRAAPSSPLAGNSDAGVVVTDVNGDGKPDVVVGDAATTGIVVLLGKGDGTFRAASGSPISVTGLTSVAAGDFNGDGKPDLAVGSDRGIAILVGNGDGTFTDSGSPVDAGPERRVAAVGDFNGDGKPDLAVIRSSPLPGCVGANCTRASLSVLLNTSGFMPPPFSGPNPFARTPPFLDTPEHRYFSATGHALNSGFKAYWEMHGSLAIFGYPISEEFQEKGVDGQVRTAQYFERARFEYHPEFKGSPYEVELGLLGREVTASRAGEAPFQPIAAFPDTPDHRFFAATGHSLNSGFKAYWEANGGLAQFGYPISEEFMEKNPDTGQEYTVQYFERERFEYHPEFAGTPYEVELGRLGAQVALARGYPVG